MPTYDPLEGVKSIGEVLDGLNETIKKGATMATSITDHEWIKRYAERMKQKAALPHSQAMQAARVAWDEMIEDDAGFDEPEDAADSEMSHWDDDGDDT